MKKVAIFGKPGSGKSTLSKALTQATHLELHALDSILFNADGSQIDRQAYDYKHRAILHSENWIIDGFGPISSFYQRLEAADTLIYIDLPYAVSYWLVTKRLLKGLFIKPAGWPSGSSVIKGTLQSYKTLKLCPKFWNDEFMQKLQGIAKGKKLYVIRSVAELNRFVEQHQE